MLNIPKSVKNLLHADSVNKNIRIHFPNGERSDICNDQIVKDSVEFTESLCSQNTLKFGLCESPIFECEVVGVGNIRGAIIEVYCEIFCDSTIEGAVWQIDLHHFVYQIPYGVFKVDTCKRQADMIYRKIVAYSSFAVNNWEISPAELLKSERTLVNNAPTQYTPNIGYFLMANGFNIIEYVCDKTDITDFDLNVNIFDIVGGDRPDSNHTYMDVMVNSRVFCFRKTPTSSWQYSIDDENAVYKLNSHKYNITKTEFHDLLYRKAMSIYQGFNSYSQEFNERSFNLMMDFCFGGNFTRGSTEYAQNVNHYPFYLNDNDYGMYLWGIPFEVEIRFKKYNSPNWEIIERETITLTDDVSKLTKYKYKDDIPKWALSTQQFPNVRYGTGVGDIPLYKVDWSKFDLQKLVTNFTELAGVFLKRKRDGDSFPVNIKQQFGLVPSVELFPGIWLTPEGPNGGTLIPPNYQNCWYDDEYTKPYGAITCQYKDTQNNDCEFTLYLDGYDADTDKETYQVYDLNNAYIKENKWNETTIQGLCEWIANSISGVTYMPVEFTGRGLPYVEAGDTFQILTKSNDSITTIVLNRTIKGEQCLIDSYKSV